MMMTRRRRLAAALVCIPLLLCACSGGEGAGSLIPSGDAQEAGAPAMGRYIEEECALPGGYNIGALHETEAGELECLVSPEEAPQDFGLYRSGDAGQSWEKQERPGLQAFLAQEDITLTSAVFGEDGDLYLLFYRDDPELSKLRAEKEARGERPDYEKDFPQNRLAIFPAEGEMAELALGFERSDGMAGSELVLRLCGEEWLICASYRTLYQFDLKTGEAENIFTCEEQVFNFAVQDQKIFVLAYNTKEIQCFDLVTGEECDRILPPDQVDGGASVLSGERESNALLLSDRTGLYRYVLGGSIWERLVDGELSSLGLPSLSGRMLCGAADGSYYTVCALMAGGSYRQLLFRYVYSDAVPTIPQEELSVYALRDNDTIRQAMGLWQRQHPDMRVSFQIGLDPQSAMTRSDALRTLSTALLAGKGPDLLVLDGLPHRSYVEKGALCDLSAFLEEKLQKGELLENIAATYRQEGKTYAIPARFGVPQLWVSEEGGRHAGSLTEFAGWLSTQQAENGWIYPDMTPEGLIKAFAISCMPAWKQEDGSLKKEPLIEFLEAIRRMSETEPEELREYQTLPEDTPPLSILGLSFTTGSVLILPGVSQGFSEARDAYAGIGTMRDGVCLPMPGQAESLYVPQTILGINAHSERQEQALSLLEAILSEAVQRMDFEDGYPVNAAAFEQSWHNPYREGAGAYSFSGETADGQPYDLDVAWPDEDFMLRQADWIRALSVPAEEDAVLLDMLLSETKGFFAGKQTAQEAAEALIGRTETYLSE